MSLAAPGTGMSNAESLLDAWNGFVTSVAWILVCAVVVGGAVFLSHHAYRKLWRVRVYYRTEPGVLIPHSFKVEEFRHLGGMVGRSSKDGHRVFSSRHTPEDAQKALADIAARETKRQKDEYERRPTWSMWQSAEFPSFEVALKAIGRIFRLFQWLLVAVAIIVVGEKASNPLLVAIGNILCFLAVIPYSILIYEFAVSRISVTQDSSVRG
jgi:hypothetical protein